MRAGRFANGEKVLRARIDMAHPNMLMRDPVMYRIRHTAHFRTGDAWCIYPTYDWAHGQSDAIEGVTHTRCARWSSTPTVSCTTGTWSTCPFPATVPASTSSPA